MAVVLVQVTAEDIKRGKRSEPCWCPIACALRRVGHHLPMVDNDHAFVGLSPERVACELPDTARSFVKRFDDLGRRAVEPFDFEIELPDAVALACGGSR